MHLELTFVNRLASNMDLGEVEMNHLVQQHKGQRTLKITILNKLIKNQSLIYDAISAHYSKFFIGFY